MEVGTACVCMPRVTFPRLNQYPRRCPQAAVGRGHREPERGMLWDVTNVADRPEAGFEAVGRPDLKQKFAA